MKVGPVVEQTFNVCIRLVKSVSNVLGFMPFVEECCGVSGDVERVDNSFPLFFEHIE